MPLPFLSVQWTNRIARHRMVGSIERMVIGLSRDEIIYFLGDPDPRAEGVLHAPSKGLAYMTNSNAGLHRMRHEFLIIFLDEDDIAVRISRR